MSGPPAGWYPSQDDPAVQRYWDGHAWTDHFQRVDSVAGQVPPARPMANHGQPIPSIQAVQSGPPADRPWYQKKRYVIPGTLILLLIVAANFDNGEDVPTEETAADTETSAAEGDTEPAAEDVPEQPDGSDGSASPPANSDLGTKDKPIPFGQPHTRDPGMLGAGWTISIDEVRTEGIELDSFFADEGEQRTCVAVIGTATLDSLDSDELTSNPFSFPSIVLIAGGSSIDSAVAECDTSALEREGMEWVLDISLAPGGTVRWFESFLVDDGVYEAVAVESTVYGER